MMKLKILYFGEVAECTGKEEERIAAEDLSDLRTYLQSEYQLDLEGLQIAINHEVISQSTEIQLTDADEIAILSPFAGG